METGKVNREYCCEKCGLIWITNTSVYNDLICPECSNNMRHSEYAIYACDTFGWFYASEGVKLDLESRGHKIHYHKNHPWYNKNNPKGSDTNESKI